MGRPNSGFDQYGYQPESSAALGGVDWLTDRAGMSAARLQSSAVPQQDLNTANFGNAIQGLDPGGFWSNMFDSDIWQGLFGGTNEAGEKFGGAAAPILSGLQLLNNYNQHGDRMEKMDDNLAFHKGVFRDNYDARRTTLNTRNENLHRARIQSNPNAYEPLDEYLARSNIKPRTV